ncbi:MAG: hypothetical protein ACTSO9_00175 [Candidatus Helarchaeota archaeon]
MLSENIKHNIEEKNKINPVKNFFMHFSDYFKDSFLLFINPTRQIQVIKRRKYSVGMMFFIICFCTLLHLIFTLLISYYYYLRILFLPALSYDWSNLLSFYWQSLLTFSTMVLPLSVSFIIIICSRFSKNRHRFYDIVKIYMSFLLIYGLYPILDVLFVFLDIDPFVVVSPLQIVLFPDLSLSQQPIMGQFIGQYFMGIFLGFLSIIIVYDLYKTKIGTILSNLSIGSLFIFMGGMYRYFTTIVANLIFNSTFSFSGINTGLPGQLFFHFEISAEGALLITSVIPFYIAYLLQNGRDFQAQINWLKSYSSILFLFIPLIGYFVSKSPINGIEIFLLIISSFLIWSLIKLFETYFEKKKQGILYKSNYEFFLLTFFLITYSVCLSLLVSFSAIFFISLMLIFGMFYVLLQKNEISYIYKILKVIVFSLLCAFAFLIGSTPTAFSFLTYDDLNVFLMFLNDKFGITTAMDTAFLFYLFNFAPIQLPDVSLMIYACIFGIGVSIVRELIIIKYKNYSIE